MSTPARHSKRPIVALEVEPRLLRDALVRALDGEGITVLDLRGGPGHCDILVSTDSSAPAVAADLVVRIGPDESSATGLGSVTDLLALIRAWKTRPAV